LRVRLRVRLRIRHIQSYDHFPPINN